MILPWGGFRNTANKRLKENYFRFEGMIVLVRKQSMR